MTGIDGAGRGRLRGGRGQERVNGWRVDAFQMLMQHIEERSETRTLQV